MRPNQIVTFRHPANGRATVEFLTLDAPYGLTRCEVKIDGGDTFPNDDQWFFSVERADPKPALIVRGEPGIGGKIRVRISFSRFSCFACASECTLV